MTSEASNQLPTDREAAENETTIQNQEVGQPLFQEITNLYLNTKG